MPFNHLSLCCPFLLPSIFPSIRVFSNESVLPIRWPKYWNFSFSISPSNEYSGLISFRMDLLNLLESLQGTLKSLLQHHSSKASFLRCSAFFVVQLSHPYMTTGKTIALTRRTFVGKVMSLLFNMLSRLVIAFLPRSKRFLSSSEKTAPRRQEGKLGYISVCNKGSRQSKPNVRYQVKEFSILCMGRCKLLGSLNSFLSYSPQLWGQSYFIASCIPSAPQQSPWGLAASTGFQFWEPSLTFGGQKSLMAVTFRVY